MADILIRKVDDATKELLRLRAERRGKSLEADLRETLETLAREEAASPDDAQPFGDWLVAISRPGVDLDEALAQLRSAPVRPISLK
ncbi:MAG: plasmid stability protein y4jJ [Bradyrhizobium sp.]|uniref:FitA-like ribbon-helix-helix domain-containing protein n=1 Tax=Bradyrhizobium sp. TaxID=376 RepID=UPI001D964E20|nr:plasmid stability protein y4jJ [Bradyrhizobium sp.]MBV9561769.1 plasmid stability protein y4jJ [Bradyrhizobium sp.]